MEVVAAAAKPTATPGRACRTCAFAKVKCVLDGQGDDAKCIRCRRLKKDCVMQAAPVRKLRTRKKTTRVAQLEQKLDGLVNLLTSRDTAIAGPYPSPDSGGPANFVLSPPGCLGGSQPAQDQMLISSPVNNSSSTRDDDVFLDIGSEDATNHLEIYRSRIMPHFPFVIISPAMSAETLRCEKPALFRAIVVAASYQDIQRQKLLGEEFLKFFTEQMIVRGEKNLDLLQAVIVYSTWYHYSIHYKKRVTNLMSLATALATDLGLTRATPINVRLTVTIDDTKGVYGCKPFPVVRTLDERRAYAGIFCVATVISTCSKELHSLRHTTYLEDCCKALESAGEYPTDALLVALTRIQALVQRITHTFNYHGHESFIGYNIPFGMYTKLFRGDFAKLKASWPAEIATNGVLLLHFHTAESYLYEIALYESPQRATSGEHCFRRMEVLYMCLLSIKSFHEVLLSIPPSLFFDLPLAVWPQVTHTIVNLSKLSFLDAEDWDLEHVREVLDFSTLLEQLISRFEAARPNDAPYRPLAASTAITGAEAGLGGAVVKNDNGGTTGLCLQQRQLQQHPQPLIEDDAVDIFSRLAYRLRYVKAKCDAKVARDAALASSSSAFVAAEQQQEQDQDQTQTLQGDLSQQQQVLVDNPEAMALLCDMDDEAFWRDVMGDWDPLPLVGGGPAGEQVT